MEATFSTFSLDSSLSRIDEILDSSDANYQEKNSIPNRGDLTFTNGFKVSASCLFVDVRDSKSLNERHTAPVRAKIYRTYISEIIAVLKYNIHINEIYVEGDGVWAIFDTPYKDNVDAVFSTAAKVSSIVDILNYKYAKKQYSQLTVGMGLDYGSSLYIKAGYKGSGISEVVWLGKVVSGAAKLCSYGNKTWSDKEIMVSSVFYNNLNKDNQNLLESNYSRSCYHGNVVNVAMNDWLKSKS